MPSHATDPRWSKVLSLTGHEVRNALSVIQGYIRFVLDERFGPLTALQRKWLEDSMSSCGRLKDIADQMGAIRDLEDGRTTFQKVRLELGALLKEAIDAVSDLPDRTVGIELDREPGEISVSADPKQLRSAIASIIFAIRREIVYGDRLIVRQRLVARNGGRVAWIAIAGSDRIDELANPAEDGLVPFDEWRGGVQLSLPIARRVINAHGGQVWTRLAEQEETVEETLETRRVIKPLKAGAVIALPID
jgi:hypothetical protein